VPRILDIAVIDDDESVRMALADSLSSLGYAIHGYASAEEFIAATDGTLFDCVVTDIHMPGMSGLDLIRYLVIHGFSSPFVLITARSEADLESKAAAAGATCLLRKPFETADLVNCLERALGR
jgi:FixJ family two-component response regulator